MEDGSSTLFSGPLSIDSYRPVSGGMSRVAMTAPSHPNSQRTTLPLCRCGLVEGSRTAACGQGQWVSSPQTASRARARVALVFVATSHKATVLPARLRRCEPPPSLTVFRSRFVVDVGTNCSSSSRASAAGPVFQAAVPSEVPPGGRRLSTWKFVLPRRPGVPSEAPSLKARGPRCLQLRACRRSFSLFEGAALGRRRFAPPRRARSRATLLPLPHPREHCDPCTQQMRCPGTRLDAEPSFSYFYREQS